MKTSRRIDPYQLQKVTEGTYQSVTEQYRLDTRVLLFIFAGRVRGALQPPSERAPLHPSADSENPSRAIFRRAIQLSDFPANKKAVAARAVLRGNYSD